MDRGAPPYLITSEITDRHDEPLVDLILHTEILVLFDNLTGILFLFLPMY